MDTSQARKMISSSDVTVETSPDGKAVTLSAAVTLEDGAVIDTHDFLELVRAPRGRRVARYARKCLTCSGTGFRPEYAGLHDGQCYYCMKGFTSSDHTLGHYRANVRNRVVSAIVRHYRDAAERTQTLTDADAGRAQILKDNPEFAQALASFEELAKSISHTVTLWEVPRTEEEREHRLMVQAMQELSPSLYRQWSEFQTISYYAARMDWFLADWSDLQARRTQVWVGAESQVVTTEITVTKVISCETQFGFTNLVIGHAADNPAAPVKWFSEAKWVDTLDDVLSAEGVEGATVTVTGTVKRHEEDHQYGRQTLFSRVKAVSAITPLPAGPAVA